MSPRNAPTPRRALILCGGGARGAIEVGFCQAITDLGISCDLVVGRSVGALNGVCIAAGMTPRELADLWRRIRRSDVLAWNWPALWRGGALMTLDPLRRLLRKTLPVFRFEDLKIPLVVTATDLQAGVPVSWHETGDVVEPVVASMSLPGIFPPVAIAGRQLVDGAVASNVPFAPALKRGVHEMLLILCTCCPAASHRLRSPLSILLRSFQISLETKYNSDLHHFRRQRISAYLFTALALVTCPCHLPILLVLLAGTAAGAYLGEHWVIAALALTVLFVLSVARALRPFGSKS